MLWLWKVTAYIELVWMPAFAGMTEMSVFLNV